VKCGLFYTPIKNGVVWEEGMPHGFGPQRYPGWTSYKLWRGDMWQCAGCNNEIIVGNGWQPMRVQHEPDYEKTREEWGGDEIPFVHDC